MQCTDWTSDTVIARWISSYYADGDLAFLVNVLTSL